MNKWYSYSIALEFHKTVKSGNYIVMHWKEEIQLCWRKPETIDCVLHWFLPGYLLQRRPEEWKCVGFLFIHSLFIYLFICSFCHHFLNAYYLLGTGLGTEVWLQRDETGWACWRGLRAAFALACLVQDSLLSCGHVTSPVNLEERHDKVRC